jgi:hypothetical protein
MTTRPDEEPVDTHLFFQQETSPYQPDQMEVGRGAMPAFIRYMPHAIILWPNCSMTTMMGRLLKPLAQGNG